MRTPGNNELVPMTRRYPLLKNKQLERDSKIARKLIRAWDSEQDQNQVFSLFKKDMHLLSDYRYWEMLRTVWIICGSVKRSPEFRKLMQSKRKNRHYFSTPEEQAIFRNLPEDEFRTYRATNDKDDRGLSWTLNLEYAKEYQQMFDKKFILEMNITKNEIFALINRNQESELIVFETNDSLRYYKF